ncbi:MAG: hypothetical protein LBG19_08435 [Prevotellaceae bacterium]|jgi:ABC-type multidrug transport system fused ATPase/permease subunit|nr:hypothetical protein [Prevotellaceae bacterium]
MTLSRLFTNLLPYVKQYKLLVVGTLLLTFIGSLTAQVNAWVLRYTVDEVNGLVEENKELRLMDTDNDYHNSYR